MVKLDVVVGHSVRIKALAGALLLLTTRSAFAEDPPPVPKNLVSLDAMVVWKTVFAVFRRHGAY